MQSRPNVRLTLWVGLLLTSAAACSGSTAASPAATFSLATAWPATASPAVATMMASASPAAASPAGTSDPAAVGPGDAWIVYQWGAGCGEEPLDPSAICLVRPDGTGQHPLPLPAGAPPNLTHPDWSPDGSRLAIERWMEDGTVEIWSAAPDGSDMAKLVACDGPPCQQVFYPAWSPGGTQLAYARFDHPAGTEYLEDRLSLEVVDLASGVRRVVARAPAVAKGTYNELVYPRWSRDGTEIVFTRTHYGTPPEDPLLGSAIAVVKADGSEVDAPRILTDETQFGAYPDWSPTQDLIVFTTYDQGYFEQGTKPANLYTIRPDGTGLARLTTFGKKDDRATQPSWTPDGKQIVFCHITYAPDGRFGSWGLRHAAFIDADGGNLTVLDGPFATHPRLRPVP